MQRVYRMLLILAVALAMTSQAFAGPDKPVRIVPDPVIHCSGSGSTCP